MRKAERDVKIAEGLGRSVSTIGRELKRNYGYGAWNYEHKRVQKLANKRRKDSKGLKISEKTCEKVLELFKMDFSPENVKVGHESSYRRIYAKIRAGRLDRQSRKFLKKASLKPSKVLLIAQYDCAMNESFKGA